MTRKLEIDWMALEGAFQIGSGDLMEMYHYLDLDTGEVIMLTSEVTRYLEEPPEVPEPEAEDDEAAREALLEDLTLLVIYLSSWEEKVAPDRTIRQAWKGYLFEVLNALEEKGYIRQTRRAKSMTLTEAGVERAQEIAVRYED